MFADLAGLLECVQLREGANHVAFGDLVVFEIEAGKQRLVEQASLFVVAAQVEHVFVGHRDSEGIKGYHHRYMGEDAGDFNVVKEKNRDANGVYKGLIYGPDANGIMRYKPSTFFPDTWTRGQVELAIERAFEVREPVLDENGAVKPDKWQGRVDGVLVEGKIWPGSSADINSAKLYDVSTAYPKYNK